jgi:hypothetical protein
MTRRKHEPSDDVNGQTGEYVSYKLDDYWTFWRGLKKKYPYEWIVLRIDHEDQSTGDIQGEIIAHDANDGVAMRAASDYHEQHPECVISFLTTDMPRRNYP